MNTVQKPSFNVLKANLMPMKYVKQQIKSQKRYKMVTINIPESFKPERTYMIETIFQQFLRINYEINSTSENDNYEIILNNGRKLIIKDKFFSSFKEEMSYLDIKNIPSKVKFIENQFLPERDIPVIYGTNEMEVYIDKIICGIDIFASSFFMLTRWEEYVNRVRGFRNRFLATESLAFKNNFLDRPVVNEYVEMLWNMLTFLGIECERGKRSYETILTHDIDAIRYWKNWKMAIRSIGADVLKHKNIKQAFERTTNFLSTRVGKAKDPYDTFSWLMSQSELANTKSHFYFMSGGNSKLDSDYCLNEPKVLEVVNEIKNRGHIIGFHPSYNSYINLEQWRKEKDILEEVLQIQVKEGRQHCLRFEVPETWQIWEDNNMDFDSTCGYAESEGFRCGVCYEYNVFNILTRKKMKLKELPLIVADGSFVTYQNVSPSDMQSRIDVLIKKVRKYNGKFVLLWHNSSFEKGTWGKYRIVYENIIRNLSW